MRTLSRDVFKICNDMNCLYWIVYFTPPVAFVATATSAYMAYRALRANHEWNRRQAALKIIEDWNDRTVTHRKAIETAIPGFVDIDQKKDVPLQIINPERAEKIYRSKPGTPDWDLRFHLIELGNYFEYIAFAYIHHVADRKILETAFLNTLSRWHQGMEHFILIVKKNRGYHPWQPFSDLIGHWNKPGDFSNVKKTG